jgi:hypothetical protein
LPPFGDKATLSSQDLVLNGSLRRLARQRVQVVAIIATNTADKLFLAEKVRAFVPDARLVTFEGDVLLAHPQFLPQTAGMLVASSSALAVPATDGSAGAARLLFDFDGAHGVYQATLDLVGDEVAPPREVFAAVVARDGLQVLDRYEVGEGGARAGDDPRRAAAEGGGRRAVLAAGLLGGGAGAGGMKPPVLWWLAVVVASALLGFVSWLVLHDLRERRPLLGLVPLDLVAPARWRRAEGAQLSLHALVVLFPLTAGLLYFVLAVPALAGASAVPTAAGLPATAVGVVAYACIGLLCVAGCYLIAGLAVRTRFELAALRGARRSRRRLVVEGGAAVLPLAVVVALAAVALGAGWLCIDRIWLRPGGADWYLVSRTLSLSTGTSPVLPAMLMIAAVLAWALIVLRREEVLRRLCPRRERRPRLAPEDPAARRLVGAVGRLWAAADPSLHGRASLRWWIGLVAVPAVYLSSLYGEGRFGAPLRGIEGRSFDGAISIVFVLLLVVVVGAGVSLARGWAALRAFAAAACCVVDRERLAGAAGQVASLDDLREAFRKLPESSPPATVAVRARVLDDDATLGAVWCDLALWLRHRESRAKSRQAAAEAAAEHAAAGAALLAQTVFRQLRHLMLFLTVALAALFFAVGSYPFEPRRVVLVYLGLLVVAAATLCVAVIVQAGRDPAVVQLAGTSETAGTWAPLVQRLSFFAGLPALSLLAGHFPQLRRVLGDWVQPLLNALH